MPRFLKKIWGARQYMLPNLKIIWGHVPLPVLFTQIVWLHTIVSKAAVRKLTHEHVHAELVYLRVRDGKTTIFFGPARNTIFNFMPVWAHGPVRLVWGPRQNLLSLMF